MGDIITAEQLTDSFKGELRQEPDEHDRRITDEFIDRMGEIHDGFSTDRQIRLFFDRVYEAMCEYGWEADNG